jgi:protein required for attachment to host cells
LTSHLNNIQNLADEDLSKYILFGRIAKLLIIFDPVILSGLRSSINEGE